MAKKMANKELTRIIGRNIRLLRERHELSVAQLAGLLGFSPAYIRLMETGKRGTNIEKLVRIAEIFEVTVNDLIVNDLISDNDIFEKMTEEPAEPDSKLRKIHILTENMDNKYLDFIILMVEGLEVLQA